MMSVVGDIPTAALELNGRGRRHALYFGPAMGTLLQVGSAEFFDFFRTPAALHALIFVKRHAPSLTID